MRGTWEERQATYKERTAKTGLGEVRVYFGHGKRPVEREFTFSKHTKMHTTSFIHKNVRVKIEVDEGGRYWHWCASRDVTFRNKRDRNQIWVSHSEFTNYSIEEGLKIGEELAEFLLSNTNIGEK